MALLLALSKTLGSCIFPKPRSTAKRDSPIAKCPDKLDFNYVFPKDGAGRTFSNCCLQRTLSIGEVMQLKWLVHSAGKIGYFAFL